MSFDSLCDEEKLQAPCEQEAWDSLRTLRYILLGPRRTPPPVSPLTMTPAVAC